MHRVRVSEPSEIRNATVLQQAFVQHASSGMWIQRGIADTVSAWRDRR